nr:MAG TPA: hypothetical protein [Caudoviricetes sp.]
MNCPEAVILHGLRAFCVFPHFRDNCTLKCCTMDKTESIHRRERRLAAWLTGRKNGWVRSKNASCGSGLSI